MTNGEPAKARDSFEPTTVRDSFEPTTIRDSLVSYVLQRIAIPFNRYILVKERDSWVGYVLLGLAALYAGVVGARDRGMNWNDLSRLATVEAVVDYHTFSIDKTVYRGTGDKVLVDGHYYSD